MKRIWLTYRKLIMLAFGLTFISIPWSMGKDNKQPTHGHNPDSTEPIIANDSIIMPKPVNMYGIIKTDYLDTIQVEDPTGNKDSIQRMPMVEYGPPPDHFREH
jgi:hypothetical protein